MKQLLREKVEAIAVIESEHAQIAEEKMRLQEINDEITNQYQLKDMIIHKIGELRKHVDSLNAELQDTSLDFKRLKSLKESKLELMEKIEGLEDKIKVFEQKELYHEEKLAQQSKPLGSFQPKRNIFNI